MRLIFMLALLSFPIAEIWILISLAHQYGWWVAFYLIIMALLGLQLIRDEKSLFSGRMMQNINQGTNPIKAIFGSAKNIIAGILLIIPGVMTDIMAVILLLLPASNNGKHPNFHPSENAANDDVIEGEYHRED